MSDDGYRGYWWAEAQRLNSLAAHHEGNRVLAERRATGAEQAHVMALESYRAICDRMGEDLNRAEEWINAALAALNSADDMEHRIRNARRALTEGVLSV
jgi:hypothetical protein